MQLLQLPNDILCHLTNCLNTTEKMALRQSCVEFNNIVDYMQIRIEKLDTEVEKLINGRMYI